MTYRSGANLRNSSPHGENESWWPVAIPENHESFKRIFGDHGVLRFSSEVEVWLAVNVGQRNRFTRDDPKPESADWQYYYSRNGPIFWFKDPQKALHFRLIYG